MFNKKKFNFFSILGAVFDGFINYVLGKIIKTPQYIRDIKDEAKKIGIKGTRKLSEYLNFKISVANFSNCSISAIYKAITKLLEGVIKNIITCLTEMYYALKEKLSKYKNKVILSY